MSLQQIIINKILDKGPVSFHDFMEWALYYPEYGYYTSEGPKIGKSGDFYTSPYFTSLFGKMISIQMVEMWENLQKIPFTIVEYGAGTGDLCRDILEELKLHPVLYKDLRYCIIEKSPSLRLRQLKLLSEKVEWFNDISELSPFSGCVLSNEVVDNFAVHLVVKKQELMEVFVDYKGGFAEILRPAGPDLVSYFTESGIELPEEYRTEVNLEATKWIQSIGGSMDKGYVITIDYGHAAHNLYNHVRNEGTLICFHQHQTNNQPYANIGRQDITAHVNFSALHHWGKKAGLNLVGYTTQSSFLMSLGLVEQLRKIEMSNPGNLSGTREKAMMINTFLMDIGAKFKVLIQQKGLAEHKLKGIPFSQAL